MEWCAEEDWPIYLILRQQNQVFSVCVEQILYWLLYQGQALRSCPFVKLAQRTLGFPQDGQGVLSERKGFSMIAHSFSPSVAALRMMASVSSGGSSYIGIGEPTHPQS
jgi:hypothetical protein